MSALDKERQPIITTTGKRGYIRICVRCGKTLVGVGQRTKYCPECRAEVYREAAMDYKARNPEKVQAAYERRKAAKRLPVYCQRCGCEIPGTPRRTQKWCLDCKKAIKAQQSAESRKRRSEICRNAQGQIVCKRCGKVIENRNGRQLYCADCRVEVDKELKAARYERQKLAQKEAGSDAENRKHVKKTYSANEERLLLLSRVADWQGINYGDLMIMPQDKREALILTYKALHHVP